MDEEKFKDWLKRFNDLIDEKEKEVLIEHEHCKHGQAMIDLRTFDYFVDFIRQFLKELETIKKET
jgi:hypothetical protein